MKKNCAIKMKKQHKEILNKAKKWGLKVQR